MSERRSLAHRGKTLIKHSSALEVQNTITIIATMKIPISRTEEGKKIKSETLKVNDRETGDGWRAIASDLMDCDYKIKYTHTHSVCT